MSCLGMKTCASKVVSGRQRGERKADLEAGAGGHEINDSSGSARALEGGEEGSGLLGGL